MVHLFGCKVEINASRYLAQRGKTLAKDIKLAHAYKIQSGAEGHFLCLMCIAISHSIVSTHWPCTTIIQHNISKVR